MKSGVCGELRVKVQMGWLTGQRDWLGFDLWLCTSVMSPNMKGCVVRYMCKFGRDKLIREQKQMIKVYEWWNRISGS